MRIHSRSPLDKIPSFDFEFDSSQWILMILSREILSQLPGRLFLLPKSQWESLNRRLRTLLSTQTLSEELNLTNLPAESLNLACPSFKPGPERIWNMMKRNQKREECSLAVCFEFWPRSTHLIKITNVSRQMNQVSKNKACRQHTTVNHQFITIPYRVGGCLPTHTVSTRCTRVTPLLIPPSIVCWLREWRRCGVLGVRLCVCCVNTVNHCARRNYLKKRKCYRMITTLETSCGRTPYVILTIKHAN